MRVIVIFVVMLFSGCSMFKPFEGGDAEARTGLVGDWSWPYKGMHWEFATDGTCRYIEYAESGHFFFEDTCSWKVEGAILKITMDTAVFPNQSLEIGSVSEQQLILKWGNTGKVMKLVSSKLLTSQSSTAHCVGWTAFPQLRCSKSAAV